MPKHKHADLIIAWANGAKIQVFSLGGWSDALTPAWDSGMKYRIKPEKEYPKSTLTDEELDRMWVAGLTKMSALRQIADTAIERYLQDQELSDSARKAT
jgi:hypothetical protein